MSNVNVSFGVSWTKYLLTVIAFLPTCTANLGCQQPNQEPIERAVNKLADEVVTPVLTKAVENLSPASLAVQGGVQAINPGYKIDGFFLWGTGLVYNTTVAVDGLAGQIQGSTLSVPAGVTTVPTSQPVGELVPVTNN
jgi:hypothetical protein